MSDVAFMGPPEGAGESGKLVHMADLESARVDRGGRVVALCEAATGWRPAGRVVKAASLVTCPDCLAEMVWGQG